MYSPHASSTSAPVAAAPPTQQNDAASSAAQPLQQNAVPHYTSFIPPHSLAYAVGYGEDVSMGERAGLHEDEGEEEGDGDDSTIRISSSHAHRHRLIQAPPVPPARSSSLRPPAVDPFIAPSQTQQQGAGGLPSFQVTQPTPTKLRHNPGGLATTDASEVSPTPGPSSRLPNQQYGANFASGAVDIQVDTHDHPVSAEPSSYAVLSVASGSTHGTEPASTSWHPNVPAVPGQALTTDEDESAEELMERAKAKEAKANRAREMGRLRQRKKRERDRQAKEAGNATHLPGPQISSGYMPNPSRTPSFAALENLSLAIPPFNHAAMTTPSLGPSSSSSTYSSLPVSASLASLSPSTPYHPALSMSTPVSGASSPSGTYSPLNPGSMWNVIPLTDMWPASATVESTSQAGPSIYHSSAPASKSAVDLRTMSSSSTFVARGTPRNRIRAASTSQSNLSMGVNITKPAEQTSTAPLPTSQPVFVPLKKAGPSPAKRRKSEPEPEQFRSHSMSSSVGVIQEDEVVGTEPISELSSGRSSLERPKVRRTASDTATLALERQQSGTSEDLSRSPTPPPVSTFLALCQSRAEAASDQAIPQTTSRSKTRSVSRQTTQQARLFAAAVVDHVRKVPEHEADQTLSNSGLARYGLAEDDLGDLRKDLGSWFDTWLRVRTAAKHNENKDPFTAGTPRFLSSVRNVLRPSPNTSMSPPESPIPRDQPMSAVNPVPFGQFTVSDPAAAIPSTQMSASIAPSSQARGHLTAANVTLANALNPHDKRQISSLEARNRMRSHSSVSSLTRNSSISSGQSGADPSHDATSQNVSSTSTPVPPQVPYFDPNASMMYPSTGAWQYPATPSQILLPTQHLSLSDAPLELSPSHSSVQTPSTGQGMFPHQEIADYTAAHMQQAGLSQSAPHVDIQGHWRAATDPMGSRTYTMYTSDPNGQTSVPHDPTGFVPYGGVTMTGSGPGSPVAMYQFAKHGDPASSTSEQSRHAAFSALPATQPDRYTPVAPQMPFGYTTPARPSRVRPPHPHTQPIESTSSATYVPFTPPSPVAQRGYHSMQAHPQPYGQSQPFPGVTGWAPPAPDFAQMNFMANNQPQEMHWYSADPSAVSGFSPAQQTLSGSGNNNAQGDAAQTIDQTRQGRKDQADGTMNLGGAGLGLGIQGGNELANGDGSNVPQPSEPSST